MRIKFDTDDKLRLDKTINYPIITIVLRANFHESDKYYPHDLLDELLYEI